jgi:uncharacterized protein (TIGR02453 family)
MSFTGFPRQCPKFFADLAKHNNKEWFTLHKPEFDEFVMAPARELVFDLGEKLKQISPKIVADPRVNKSIFRINRDTRFSKDKTPYKTHLAMLFWEGPGEKMESPSFYLHLESKRLMLGAGIYMFSKPQLGAFRDSVVHKKHGAELEKVVTQVEKKGHEVGIEHYKKVPRGYDPDHPRAELLKYSGLCSMTEGRIPAVLYKKDLVNYCYKQYKEMAPLHKWLVALSKRT